MSKHPLFRLCVTLLIVAACVVSMTPLETKLKLGLDLAGGTQLIYQVDVPEGQDAQTVVDQVIAVLRKRLDPNGVMNLIWRPLAGNRIEIQIPEATAKVKALRIEYTDAHKALIQDNIPTQLVTNALRMTGEERAKQLDAIAGNDEKRREAFRQLAVAYDALQQASAPKEDLSAQLSAVEREQLMLAADAGEDVKRQLANRKQELIGKLEEAARAFNQADRQYKTLLASALGSNVNEAEIKQLVSMPSRVPPKSQQKAGQEGKTLRQIGMENLIAKHPDKADAIKNLVDKYTAYESVKGPIDDPNDLITMLKGSGVLEFRIAPGPGALPDEGAYRQQLQESGPTAGRDKPYRWFIIDDIAAFADTGTLRELLEKDPDTFFRNQRLVGQAYGVDYYVLLANTEGLAITGANREWKLDHAGRGMDQSGFPAVTFTMNAVGGHLMGELTGTNVEKPMAIVLDNRVISTPNIRERISGNGQISGGAGGFSEQELSYLVRTLNAGSLQGRLSERPISMQRYGPQFGQDNLKAGLESFKDAFIIVALFMAAYYLFWGVVADIALIVNLILVVGVMAALQATWTLPGIAGLVLTIGMAVDANVLIYERIREETFAGVDLERAVRLGFDKALSTIVDSNLTTLITCVVLYYTASADIKGFALTLGIGLVANLFTALYVSRSVIDLYMNGLRPRSLPMLPIIVPAIHRLFEPNINWVGKSKLFMTCSGIILAICLAVTFTRGSDLLDIEFRSGTQVGFKLKESAGGMTLEEARTRLAKAADSENMPELKTATVVSVGEMKDLKANALSIAVLNEDSPRISEVVKNVFADVLETERKIAFANQDAVAVDTAPVYRVVRPQLGHSINRPEITDEVGEYLGGVAVVLSDMNPPASKEELTRRIERMRMQTQYESLGLRTFEVIGLDMGASGGAPGEILYRTVAVVSRDGSTNYIENPDAFNDPQGLAATEWHVVHDALRRDVSLESVSNFSSQVSDTMRYQAMQALVLSLAAVVVYIWLRFGSVRYGMAAIVALVHDVIFTLGLIAGSYYFYDTAIGHALGLSDFKINLALIAALLTIVGYSLNDTIVVFDRIRENKGRRKELTAETVNHSINQTISRTIITAGTTLLAVFMLYMFGGDGVKGFAFSMLVGISVGTYSSIAIAAPILLMARDHVADDESPAEGTKAIGGANSRPVGER